MVDVRVLPVGERNEITITLDQLAREDARRRIAAALWAEANEFVERFSEELDEEGHWLVVRNGRARERRVTSVRARCRSGRRVSTTSAWRRRPRAAAVLLEDLPAYARRSPKVTEVLPILCLRGPPRATFARALGGPLGEDASGLSSSTISRLCKEWETHHERFRKRLLFFGRFAYLFVDGIHVSVRLGETTGCVCSW